VARAAVAVARAAISGARVVCSVLVNADIVMVLEFGGATRAVVYVSGWTLRVR
jgi:hypothetical protein